MKKIAFPLIVAAMGLVASAAHAAPASNGGVLTINGQLTANTCTVSGNGQGTNFTVTLPTLAASALSAAGATAGSTGFNIALTACTPSTGNVHTFWEYGSNTLADGNLLNNGTATKVEVQLVDYNGTRKVLDVSKADGAQNAQNVAITSGAASLQYAAQYVSPAGGATAGTVTTNVTYSMIYQ
ncbi:Major fimbrial subunit SMF-1 [Paraburkholderia graminis C4D1M]|jgi:major type 1 subunit fimbrin (pilin)|uniref:Fimbrial protein n=1 Tax=Paraburkholderia graminis (strain ATCC 700544 / DSM 17151 / LMG 18924 / NCIMB 13744 / C4D1M) TaxID=396598 RepID=B1FY73_PARG4|nr:fimbrial protein [Paraburkholderia graminis]EDT11399.1 Fimbrial protein [Paraburkholderia graminis C4D1M]CAB3695314.1 Major fimbrial subunit SMF-1 [Paraburkholderia graminis C4D1M]